MNILAPFIFIIVIFSTIFYLSNYLDRAHNEFCSKPNPTSNISMSQPYVEECD